MHVMEVEPNKYLHKMLLAFQKLKPLIHHNYIAVWRRQSSVFCSLEKSMWVGNRRSVKAEGKVIRLNKWHKMVNAIDAEASHYVGSTGLREDYYHLTCGRRRHSLK